MLRRLILVLFLQIFCLNSRGQITFLDFHPKWNYVSYYYTGTYCYGIEHNTVTANYIDSNSFGKFYKISRGYLREWWNSNSYLYTCYDPFGELIDSIGYFRVFNDTLFWRTYSVGIGKVPLIINIGDTIFKNYSESYHLVNSVDTFNIRGKQVLGYKSYNIDSIFSECSDSLYYFPFLGFGQMAFFDIINLYCEIGLGPARSHLICYSNDSLGSVYFNDFLIDSIDNCSEVFYENKIVETHFSIYPNPVDDILILEKYFLNTYEVEIYDIIGRLIHNFEFKENMHQINMKYLLPGIYNILIRDSEKVLSYKVIKI